MAILLGSAYVAFGVDNTGLRTGINEAVQMLQQFQQQTRKPLQINTQQDFMKQVDAEEQRIRARIASIKALNQQAGGAPSAANADVQALQKYISLQAERALKERDFYRAAAINAAQARTLQPGSSAQQQNLIQRQKILDDFAASGRSQVAVEEASARAAAAQLKQSEQLALRAALAQKDYAAAVDVVKAAYLGSGKTLDDYNRAVILFLSIQKTEQAEVDKTTAAFKRQFDQMKAADRSSGQANVKLALSTGTPQGTQAAVDAIKAQITAMGQAGVGTDEWKNKLAQLNQVELLLQKQLQDAYNSLTKVDQGILTAAIGAKDYARALDVVVTAYNNSNKSQDEYNRMITLESRIMKAAQKDVDDKINAQKKLDAAQTKAAKDQAAASAASRKTLLDENKAFDNQISTMAILQKELSQLTQGTDAYRKKLTELKIVQDQISKQGAIRPVAGASAAGGGAAGLGFLGVSAEVLTGIIGPLTIATIAYQAFNIARTTLSEGFALNAELETETRSIISLIGGLQRGNSVFAAAIAYGKEFGQTQKQMGEAAQDAALLLRTSTVETEKALEILGRLQSRVPTKSFNDAVRSIQELQTGQLQSIERVFNIPQVMAQGLQRDIRNGVDVFEALDKVLNRLGATTELLKQRNQGTTKAINDLHLANEELSKQLGAAIEGPWTFFIKVLAAGEQALSKMIVDFRILAFPNMDDFNAGVKSFQDTTKGIDWKNMSLGEKILNGFFAALTFGTGVYDHAETRFKANTAGIRTSILELQQELVKLDPELAKFGAGWDVAGKVLDPATMSVLDANAAMQKQRDVVNALINQYTSGSVVLSKFQENMINATNVPAADPFKILAGLDKTLPVQEQFDKLQGTIIALGTLLQETPDIKNSVLIESELNALIQKSAELKALMPLEVTIAMQMEEVSVITGAMDAIRDAAKNLNKSLGDLDKQHAEQLGQLGTQRKKIQDAEDDRAARAAADRAKSLRRRQEDEDRADQRSLRDFNASQAKAEEDYGKQLIKIDKDTREALQKQQRDYDINLNRDTEDFNIKRLRLLAEGKIKEAQRLTEDFNLDQKRKREDLARARGDIVDNGGSQKDDATVAFRTQRAAAIAARAQALADLKEDRDRAHQRDAEDYAQQLADQAKAHKDQLQAIKDQIAEVNRKYAEQHQTLIDNYNTFVDEQNAKILEATALFKRQLELMNLGLAPEIAKAIAQVDAANTALTKQLNEIKDSAGTLGAQSAIQWLLSWARTLQEQLATGNLNPLDPNITGTGPKAPPSKVNIPPQTFKSVASSQEMYAQGISNGKSYAKGVTDGSDQQFKSKGVNAPVVFNDSGVNFNAISQQQRAIESARSGIPGTRTMAQGRQVAITIPVSVTLDGQSVATIITPTIAKAFIDDLEISTQVVKSSNTPALQQQAFREVRTK